MVLLLKVRIGFPFTLVTNLGTVLLRSIKSTIAAMTLYDVTTIKNNKISQLLVFSFGTSLGVCTRKFRYIVSNVRLFYLGTASSFSHLLRLAFLVRFHQFPYKLTLYHLCSERVTVSKMLWHCSVIKLTCEPATEILATGAKAPFHLHLHIC